MSEKVKTGDLMFYGYEVVKIVRPSYPRFGRARVVVERESDKRRFTVNTEKLRPVTRLETDATLAARGETEG